MPNIFQQCTAVIQSSSYVTKVTSNNCVEKKSIIYTGIPDKNKVKNRKKLRHEKKYVNKKITTTIRKTNL